MLFFYRFVAQFLSPFLRLVLRYRLTQGKEDPARLTERFGKASCSRPPGKLIWIHAASVGEATSVLRLMTELRSAHPEVSILLTTGTVTAAGLMAQRLSQDDGVIHQFIPLDVPRWIRQFLDHWHPQAVVFLESEIWPAILHAVSQRSIPLILLNAHLSEKSYRRWRWGKFLAKDLFSSFDLMMTPSSDTAVRLKNLGAPSAELTLNLKFTAAPLPIQTTDLIHLKGQVKNRLFFTAVSTHPGEEEIILDAYQRLQRQFPTLLLILAPRHPHRADSLEMMLSRAGVSVARRSRGEIPTADQKGWLIDTIGDLGLIYSLVPFCFLGGSLSPIGGHNAIEPLMLDCLVIQGPQTFKSTPINAILAPVLATVHTVDDLVGTVETYLTDPQKVQGLHRQAKEILAKQQEGLEKIMQRLMEFMK
jgi:3-deoxy-D-manno-octulosonic-acid transferase